MFNFLAQCKKNILSLLSAFKKSDQASGYLGDSEGGVHKSNCVSNYDTDDYDIHGYDRHGHNWLGYDRDGFHYSGYSLEGFDRQGYNRAGYDREGYDRCGLNRKGLSKERIVGARTEKRRIYCKDCHWSPITKAPKLKPAPELRPSPISRALPPLPEQKASPRSNLATTCNKKSFCLMTKQQQAAF